MCRPFFTVPENCSLFSDYNLGCYAFIISHDCNVCAFLKIIKGNVGCDLNFCIVLQHDHHIISINTGNNACDLFCVHRCECCQRKSDGKNKFFHFMIPKCKLGHRRLSIKALPSLRPLILLLGTIQAVFSRLICGKIVPLFYGILPH